jgi:hypothetical protein
MRRTVTVLALLALAGPASAAPTLKEPKQALYFPTTEGVRRVYEIRVGDTATEVTEVVTKVEKKDGVFRVSIGSDRGGEVKPMNTVEVSAKGVFRVAVGNRELPAPTPLLKLPAKRGDTWEWTQEGPGATGPVTTVFTVGEEIEIEVPAGKFNATPVEAVTHVKDQAIKATYWYAPGVGVVKMVTYSGPSERTQVLKSFTPNK